MKTRRKFTPTEAQKKAAEERRERFRQVVQQVASMTDDQRAELAASLPVVSCEGQLLSVHNCCLIASQFPTATIVGGFRQWLAHGRAVKKGEHGIMIWVPTVRGEKGEDGKINPETAERGFIPGTVFDVSQTEARE